VARPGRIGEGASSDPSRVTSPSGLPQDCEHAFVGLYNG
jgi:hypothetical protein